MAISVINIGRVSENLRTFSIMETLRKNTLDLFAEQNRLATGERLNALSDDPVLATQALNLTTRIEQQQQVIDNLRAADTFLAVADSTIGEITNLLNEVHDLVLANIGDVNIQGESEAAAILVDNILGRLIEIGNRTYNGMYLFGGRETETPPLAAELGGVLFSGDTGDLEALVELATTVSFNVTADDIFGAISSEVRGYADLNPALTSDTRLTDLNGATGRGVRPASIAFTDVGAGVAFTVDLTNADRISDVISRINNAATAAGSTISVSMTTTGLQVTAGGNFSIVDPTGASMAADLGITQSPAAAGPLVGIDVDPRLTARTPVTALDGGTGIDLTGGLKITSGINSVVIDLSAATTFQDILNAINGVEDVPVRASINAAGDGIDVLNPLSGIALRIGENTGTTADDLGIRSLYGGTPLAGFNNGQGVGTVAGKADIRILAKDGTTQIDVDLSTATTVQDVINLINAAGGASISAGLVATGNGIRITDTTGGVARDLQVQTLNFSTAATDLGLAQTVTSPGTVLLGSDVNGVRPDGVFTTLMAIRDAFRADDRAAMQRTGARLETLIDGVIRTHGQVGAESQAMNRRLEFAGDAMIATRSFLSQIKDLDYTEAITRFQQLQMTLQANLQTSARLLQISLMDFL